jgi:hypothetical protein
LLLTIPAEDDEVRKQWSKSLEPRCQSVVVDSDVYSVPLSVVCIAPTAEAAESIVQEFNDCTAAYEYQPLISPWCTDPPLSHEHKLARKTLRLLQDQYADEESSTENEKAMAETFRKRAEASRRGDKETVEKLDAERNALIKARQDRHIESVRSRNDVDQELVAIYARQPAYPDILWDEEMEEEDAELSPAQLQYQQDRKAWCQEVAVRLGQVPASGDDPELRIDRHGVESGYASNAGLLMRFDFIRFHRPVDGIPTFAEWLYAQKCVDLKYRLGDNLPSEE